MPISLHSLCIFNFQIINVQHEKIEAEKEAKEKLTQLEMELAYYFRNLRLFVRHKQKKKMFVIEFAV